MNYTLPDRQTLPLIVEPEGEDRHVLGAEILESFLFENRGALLARLRESGALLFRGFAPRSVPALARFAEAFAGSPLADYTGGASPRISLGGGVYTSTEYPKALSLSLHNELSYTVRSPEYLFFYCETPATEGGETPIADSRAILKALDPAIVRRFKTRKIRYERRLENAPDSEYSWQAAFETNDARIVEDFCADCDIAYRWNDDGSLRLCEIRPATAKHPTTGEEVWFNQAEGFHPSSLGDEAYQAALAANSTDALRLNAYFGDGGDLEIADLEHIRAVTREQMVLVSWQRGDILVLDNVLACHGRMPFSGPRKIFLAMA
ncbi:MAG TPA: TauD/TfdA family dioxygenase [Pyrinomonadaceae bacterium]|nr:TauD/TfdA family dioxygenase [Pyrinomonadaceae bacterium]